MTQTKVTSDLITSVDASKLTGTLPASMATDTTPIENDLAILALQNAVNSNISAHGLQNSWIEQFEDSTAITGLSTAFRSDQEYMATGSSSPVSWPYTNYADQGFSKFGASDEFPDISVLNSAGTTHTRAGHQVSGYLDYAPSPSGFTAGIQFDYLTAKTWLSLDMGFRNVHGMIKSWRLESSDNGSDWTIVDQTGSTASASSQALTNNNNFSIATDATGVITNVTNTGNSPTTHGGIITFGTAVTSRHLRFSVGSFVANSNSNCGVEYFIPQYNQITPTATGSFTSTTITPQDSANKSSIGLVVLYKEQAGSTTLNTHLVAKVRANASQAYQTVTLANKGTFSTGIKIAIAPAISVTAGQALSYEISFAGQSSGSLETQVHGVALQY